MQKVFPQFFFLIALFISACGQKGDLYLGKEKPVNKSPVFSAENQPKAIRPELIAVNQSIVVGQIAQINRNSTLAWQTVLAENRIDTNLVRYIVFKHDVLSSDKDPMTLLIGSIQANPKANDPQQPISAGSYLRFRSKQSGANQVTVLLSQAKQYFNDQQRWRQQLAANFLTENQQYIDLYIPVERTP